MNWAWASSLDHIWRSPSFPAWVTLAAAGFFAILLLIVLLRAQKSVANFALAVITLLAVGIAATANFRSRKLTNSNNMSGLSIPQVTIQSNGFNIDGSGIELGSGGIQLVGGTTAAFGLPLTISSATTPVEVRHPDSQLE